MTPPPLSELEESRVEDASLLDEGVRVLEWTRRNMPVLATLRDELAQERALAGRRIGMCLHVEAKTALSPRCCKRRGGARRHWQPRGAFQPGYNRVLPEIDRAVAEEALATLSTVERDGTLRA